MFVRDIIEQASEVSGLCADGGVNGLYDLMTDAIEILANKANWDTMQGYLDIFVQSGNTVILPGQVEYPIKININENPSFSRDKLYEFVMNGPGNDMAEVASYNWMDKGTVPTIRSLSSPDTVGAVAINAADSGGKITIVGQTSDGTEVTETLVLSQDEIPFTTTVFASLTRISKTATVGEVQFIRSLEGTILATYGPKETSPDYRKIVLSVHAPSLRILYRRKTSKITSDDDFIPLHSKLAVLLMMKAIWGYKHNDFDNAAKLEETAIKFIKEEQESLRNFTLTDSTEKQPILDLNINNADSIIVADIYDDAAEILGNIGRQGIFDAITEGVEILNNKSIWDGLEGYVDLCVEGDGIITLPRYVETPVAINIGGRPRQFRNKWFEFHLNGTGSGCSESCGYIDLPGDVVTLRDVSYKQQLTASADFTSDIGKEIRVFGYDDNKWIMTADGPNGALKDGFPVVMEAAVAPTVPIPPPPSIAQSVDMITRITKPITNGFVRLTGHDIGGTTNVTVGYYYPDETEPSYSRIKVGCGCSWVRMRYRKRMMKVTSLTDPLHLKSKLAIMMAIRSMVLLKAGKFTEAEQAEQKAFQFLVEEQQSRHPAETMSFQIDNKTYMSDPLIIT